MENLFKNTRENLLIDRVKTIENFETWIRLWNEPNNPVFNEIKDNWEKMKQEFETISLTRNELFKCLDHWNNASLQIYKEFGDLTYAVKGLGDYVNTYFKAHSDEK